MAFTYTYINGERVETSVARAFEALRAEFKRVWGLDLLVSSGTRTREEQAGLYQIYLNGGTLAAPPGQSNHEEYGPRGPRALDVRDSGGDPGVTRQGTARANWLRANASRFGFDPAGYGFRQIEPWHIEYTGNLGGGNSGTSPDGKLIVDGDWGAATTTKLQAALGVNQDGQLGPITIKALQSRLGVNADGDMGPQTIGALQRRLGVGDDGQLGPVTIKALQQHLNDGGTLAAPLNPDVLTVDGQLGRATVSKLQASIGAEVDGEWGPGTTRKLQVAVGATEDGQLGPDTIKKLQANVGATQDGDMGPETIKKLQEHLNAGRGWRKIENPPVAVTPGESEWDATPSLVTPSASDFPAWIKYDESIDPETFEENRNLNAKSYYGRAYDPIEVHTHWWGLPGKAGTHDGNVSHLKSTKDLSTNFVTSAGRITLMMPLNKIALTTGARNPYGWKSENDPALTELGYRTLGFLVYLVEKLNPKLKDEPIRLHKEFMNTSCSGIDVGRVRAIADDFVSGRLDPATGLTPKSPEVDPAPTPAPSDLLTQLRVKYAELGVLINKLEG